MKTKFMCAAIIIILYCLQTSWAQTHSIYCGGSRFDTSDVFSNAELQSSDIIYGHNIDWKGKTVDLHLSLYYPDKHLDTFSKRPLMVLIHGGGFLTGSYTGEKDDEKYFARKGFVTASIDYRLGWNDQCIPNNISITDAVYRGMQDAKAALRYLVANASVYKIDTGYIFLFGKSAGAVASLFISFINEDEYNLTCPGTTRRLGHLDNATNSLKNTFSIKGVASRSGAVSDTSFISSNESIPVLMFHGTADHTVPFATGHPYDCVYDPILQGSSDIQKRLNTIGEIYELDYDVGAGHGDVYEGEDSFFYHRLSHFFKRILCNRFREIIYEDMTLIQNSASPCNSLLATVKSKTNVSCIGGADGSITVGKTGGESPFQYKLNNKAYQTTNFFGDLKADIYTATVKDNRNCTASIATKIADGKISCIKTQQNNRAASSLLYAKVFPNPSASAFTLMMTNSKRNYAIEVTDVYGRTVLHTNEIAQQPYIFGQNFIPGIYIVKITEDDNITTLKVIKEK